MLFSQLNLSPEIIKALHECGYTIPTPIQAHAIPEILDGKDLVASAQTGTGKTAAFMLPALHKLSLVPMGVKPRILVLTPTRELSTQIVDAARKYGKFLRFNMASLVGGMPYRQQLKALSRPVDVIIATPGRLIDHMENRRLDLSQIEMLILDEADRMLDMGFIDDVKYIANATSKKRQTLLFSATVDDKLGSIIKQLLNNPVRIDLSEKTAAPVKIKQELYITDHLQHKTKLLQHFLNESGIFKGIIFSAMKVSADKLAKQLRDQDISALPLHGDLKQSVRNKTIEEFRRGKVQFLVATDIAARGLDINDVTHVINFDLPKFSEDYVHRIGRTGRAGKSGIAISFALPNEARHVQKIERFIGERIELSTIQGLEPKQGFSQSSSSGNKRSRHGGKSTGDFKKRGGFRSDRNGSEGNGRGEGRRFDSGKSDFKKKSGFRSERNGSEGNGRGEERRFDSGKSDFKKKSDFRSERTSSEGNGRSEERRFDSSKSDFKKKSGFRSERNGSEGNGRGEERRFDSGKSDFKKKSTFRSERNSGEERRFDRGKSDFKKKSSFRDDRSASEGRGRGSDKSARSPREPGEKSLKKGFIKKSHTADKAAKLTRGSKNEKIKYV